MTIRVGLRSRGVSHGSRGTLLIMMVFLVLVGLLCWFVLSVPLAMVVGQAFRAGQDVEPGRSRYNLAN